MKTSDQTANIFEALAKAQGALEPAIKDSTNPAFRSKYADLTSHVEAIRPAFKGHDLAMIQELTSDDSGVHVTTRITHKSGEWIEFGPFYIPASKHDAHGFGSACSYARRYALSAAVGTVADDDDGNAAVQNKPQQQEALPRPVGYDEWFLDMQALAESVLDLQVFKDSYKASPKKHRHYAEETNMAAVKAWAERAKQNEDTLLLAAREK